MTESESYEPSRTLIRDLRISASMTQADLAIKSGVSIAYVQRLESGLIPQRHGTPALTAVLDALGLSESQLRGGVPA